jgi:hypothetical protein
MFDGSIDVLVKKLEVADAITGEEGVGHGAVESGWELRLVDEMEMMYELPHIACHQVLKMR